MPAEQYGTVASSAIANSIMFSMRFFYPTDVLKNIYLYTMLKELIIFVLDVCFFHQTMITAAGTLRLWKMPLYERFTTLVTPRVVYKFIVTVCIGFILIDTIVKAILKFIDTVKLTKPIQRVVPFYDVIIRILVGGMSSILIMSYLKNIWVYNEDPEPNTNLVVIMWFGLSLLIYSKQC
jgi:hypothetical protein